MRVLLALLLCLSSLAQADTVMVARHPNGDVMYLHDTPCKNAEVLAHVPVEYRKLMQSGRARVSGVEHSMCWLLNPAMLVVAVYEDGEAGVVPVQAFAPR